MRRLPRLKEVKPTPPNVTIRRRWCFIAARERSISYSSGAPHRRRYGGVFAKEKIVATGDLMESRLAYMGERVFRRMGDDVGCLEEADSLRPAGPWHSVRG